MSKLYLPDSNVLIHALRKNSAAHPSCRQWLLDCVQSGAEIGLSELVETSLLRIATHPKVGALDVGQVLSFWAEDLWAYPGTLRLAAGKPHRAILKKLVSDLSLSGNDLNDAWLAALAIEHGAILISTDEGFKRFPGLIWQNPVRV
ncbi:MAG: hypothetical protein RL376_12 [Verrucomicrobiota bacterium]